MNATSLTELQWAHQTLIRMVRVIAQHAYLGDAQIQANLHLSKGILWLETIIQEQTRMARRRHDDRNAGSTPSHPAQDQGQTPQDSGSGPAAD